jgi:2-polyprenyl-6-methoxyphenol hydroxylase-like FAD-dependent oxidoreductase
MSAYPVVIAGGGIAGLTLGILLKESGWDPVVIERNPAPRSEGYMMDFFGSGWDVAERMGLVEEIRTISYPFDRIAYVDPHGKPRFPPVPLERIRQALQGKYAYLRRQDLERILYARARASGVPIRFGTTIRSIAEQDDGVHVTFGTGATETFHLLFGADGVHSHIRELIFGEESRFDRFLGYYVAAVHVHSPGADGDRAVKIYEEPGRVLWVYPLGNDIWDAVYIFRHDAAAHLPRELRLSAVREHFQGAGWIAARLLDDLRPDEPLYFDTATQIVLPTWFRGRTALLGDACGCLTLLAGQGSHMAMAEAYVLAHELTRRKGDYSTAFPAYEQFMQPIIREKQKDAVRVAKTFVPSSRVQMLYRYQVLRLVFSSMLIRHFFARFGVESVLSQYP